MYTPGEQSTLDNLVMFPGRGPDNRGLIDPSQAMIDEEFAALVEQERVLQREKTENEIARVVAQATVTELSPELEEEREDYLRDLPHTD